MLGSLSIVVAHHMYAMPPYPYIATDYTTYSHHMWIGGFCVVGVVLMLLFSWFVIIHRLITIIY
jgi:hypothetical protein